jgi:hypothetical protein
LFPIYYRLQSGFVSLKFFITTHKFIRLVILTEGITILVDLRVPLKDAHCNWKLYLEDNKTTPSGASAVSAVLKT